MTMADNIASGFVSLENLVTEVLYNIDDVEKKKYYPLTLQKVLNAIRNLNVNHSPLYNEVPMEYSKDLGIIQYPLDLVKVISVGIYMNGKWFSFTNVPEMDRTRTGDGETADEDIGEGGEVPRRGFRFGARGFNIAYWVDDPANRRLFVRNYEKDKVILKYRSNGVKCTTDVCVPFQMKDLVVKMVTYEYALMRKPFRFTAAELQALRLEKERHYDEWTDLEYLPQNMAEFQDSQWNSFNSTVRRG